ncbi:uncharacterized protein [Littorina saxatilis]|uniref:uncharacterized protein isoform X2 n=1 Tax=Littorina saxatilis TaxID=31220 RepID=UPI0038B48049
MRVTLTFTNVVTAIEGECYLASMFLSRNSRSRLIFRYVAGVLLLLVVVVMVRPLRNSLIPVWPRIWRDVSTLDIVRMYNVIHASTPLYFLPQPCSTSAQNPSGWDGELTAYLIAVSRDTATRRHSQQGLQDALQADRDFFLEPRHVQSEVASLRNVSAAVLLRASHTQRRADHWLSQSGERVAKYGRFRPLLTPADTQSAVTLLMTFDLACRAAGVTYFLTAGSLLGWYRHGGLIPWDDDLDVALNVQHAHRAWKILSCLPGLGLRVVGGAGAQWKLFYLTPGKAKGFPSVDIMLVTSDQRFVWSLVPFAFPKDMTFHYQNVVPLRSETFEGVRVLVPRLARAELARLYDAEQCVSPEYDHRRDVGLKAANVTHVPCAELTGMYTLRNV